MTARRRFQIVLGLYGVWLAALAGLAVSSGIAPRSSAGTLPSASGPVEATVPR